MPIYIANNQYAEPYVIANNQYALSDLSYCPIWAVYISIRVLTFVTAANPATLSGKSEEEDAYQNCSNQ